MRKLKFHEQKLMKKVDFYDWKNHSSLKKAAIVSKYRLSSRADYTHYQKIVGYIRKLAVLLKKDQGNEAFKKKLTEQLLEKLYVSGLIPDKSSLDCVDKVAVSSFLRRRLLVMLKHLKLVENLKESETYIHHGHIRVGSEVVKDPDFFVTRQVEDFITWNEASKLRKKIRSFHNQTDDYEA